MITADADWFTQLGACFHPFCPPSAVQLCCVVNGRIRWRMSQQKHKGEKASYYVFLKSVSVLLGNNESVMMLRTARSD